MASKAIIGGLLSGAGEGMISRGERRREEAAALREAALERAREQREQDFEREQAATEHERKSGLLDTTKTDAQGRLIGVTRGGEAKPLGVQMPMEGEGGSGSGAGGAGSGGDGLSGTDRNLMERVARNYWGRMNAAGQFIMPEDARDNYVQTLERAGDLANAGIPITTATRISAMSISGPLSESEAKEQAEKEASEQFGGWTQGDERSQYVEGRVPELMEESRAAQKEYERLVGRGERGGTGRGGGAGGSQGGLMGGGQRQSGGGQDRGRERATGSGGGQQRPQAQGGQRANAPPGQGTQADPYKATTQQHIDWFRENAPEGAVIEANGQLYTK